MLTCELRSFSGLIKSEEFRLSYTNGVLSTPLNVNFNINSVDKTLLVDLSSMSAQFEKDYFLILQYFNPGCASRIIDLHKIDIRR
jgi:hypothetical protein